MEKFEIKGEKGFFRISLTRIIGFPETTSAFGGYDTESTIEVKSSNYYFKGLVWITTGNIFNFFQELEKCQKNLKGMYLKNCPGSSNDRSPFLYLDLKI